MTDFILIALTVCVAGLATAVYVLARRLRQLNEKIIAELWSIDRAIAGLRCRVDAQEDQRREQL